MKYIITENKLKNLIKKEFNLDLTGKVKMITSASQVPYEFDAMFSSKLLNNMMNMAGPMYMIKHYGEYYLIQPMSRNEYRILDTRQGYLSESDLYDKLGIPPFISLMDLINTYLDEENELNESVKHNYSNIIRKFVESKNFKGVDKVEVVYDKHLDRYEVHVYFNKEYGKSLGLKFSRHRNDVLYDIESSMKEFLPELDLAMYGEVIFD